MANVNNFDQWGKNAHNATPIMRITNTILMYGIRDGATRIRVEKHALGVRVDYEIHGEWHEQMKVPAHVWEELWEHLKERAAAEKVESHHKGRFAVTLREKSYDIQLDHETFGSQERMTLDLS